MSSAKKPKSGTWILFSLLALIALSAVVYFVAHHFAPVLEKSFGIYCY